MVTVQSTHPMTLAEWQQRHQDHEVHRRYRGPAEIDNLHYAAGVAEDAGTPQVEIALYCWDCKEEFVVDRADYNPDDWPPGRDRPRPRPRP